MQYEPAGQVEHSESPDACANEPAWHCFGAVAPGAQEVPAWHRVWVCGFRQKKPALHVVMLGEPLGQYVPVTHGVGAVEPAAHHDLAGHMACVEALAQK